LKLNGTHQLIVYSGDVNILGGRKKSTETSIVASKETGVEVNAEKTKHVILSREPNTGKNHNIYVGNKFLERVEQFKYLGTTLTNQNFIPEYIKRKLNSGNACYHSVQNLLSSSLLVKYTKIYKTVLLSAVLYECKTWSLTLTEEHRLRVFENRVLRKIFASKKDKVTGEWRRLHNEKLYDLYSSPNIIRVIK
jgi:hypothetical protein